MRLHFTADSVKVDDDEGRIVLIVETDEGDTVTVNIHNVALEFYADVRREIGPWAAEADSARRAVAAGVSLKTYMGAAEDEDETGYAPDDPKHPTYYERMVD